VFRLTGIAANSRLLDLGMTMHISGAIYFRLNDQSCGYEDIDDQPWNGRRPPDHGRLVAENIRNN
jgi:hypothetical protein